MSPSRDNKQTIKARPSVAQKATVGPLASAQGGSQETLVSRRRFLYGAIGVGAVAAIGVGAAAYTASVNAEDKSIDYLDAPANALTTLNDFEALESFENHVQQIGEYDLPYGTLLWANDEDVAACLLPTEKGSPLTKVGLLFLGSGSCLTVLEKAVGATDGFEIYDVRANSNGLVWTEANILQGDWRIYSATVSVNGGSIGEPHLLEEGGSSYETPTIAVAGSRAFWQVNPKSTGADAPSARLMGATFGKEDVETMLESPRQMSSPPYAYGDTITVCPRVDSTSVYYQLTNIDAKTGEIRDTLILPHAIKPIEGGYGKTGFMFSFPDIYNYDGAIANLGTYTPLEKPSNGDYSTARWFDFARTPTAPPAWCDNLLIVKSTYSVCGVDLNKGVYFAIDVDDGADTYGEYLASTGDADSFVTYTNIDHTPVGEERIYACRVKVWAPLDEASQASEETTAV